MNILFLTDNFPPEVNASASRTFEHCREWVRAGHSVTVVTCAPNFPNGKVFPGYANRVWQSEDIDGIHVIRLWTYITANEGFLRRSLDYSSFMAAAVLAAPFLRRADIVVATSPHIFTACAGWAVAGMKRVPFVFELRDLWPASIKAVGAMRNERMLRRLEQLELFLYRRASVIVSVTHSFRRDLISRAIPAEKIEVITNGVDARGFYPREKDPELVARYGLAGKFVAGYLGTLGMAHALETLLSAAERLQSNPTAPDVAILIIGEGAEKICLLAEAKRRRLKNVTFIDAVPKAEVARYWSLLDASIIHLKKTELFTTVIPSKLFEAMATGVPVLLGVKGEAAEIVARHDVGIAFEPEDAAMLAEQIVRLAHDRELCSSLAAAGPRAARYYDRTVLAAKMLSVLEATAAEAVGERRVRDIP